MKKKIIAIEGNIGAGKTSMAKKIASQLDAFLILESFEANPFLEKFYSDKEKFALDTEMWFLKARENIFLKTEIEKVNNQIIVSDYVIEKSYWFAKKNLNKTDFLIFENEFEKIVNKTAFIDLLIVLHHPVEILVKNINARGREYEKNINEEYLRKLNDVYLSFGSCKKIKKTINIHFSKANEKSYSDAFDIITSFIDQDNFPEVYYL